MIKKFLIEIIEVYSELQGFVYFFKDSYVAIPDHLIGYTTVKSYFFNTKEEAEDFIAQKTLKNDRNRFYMLREYKENDNYKYIIEPCTLVYIKQGFLPGLQKVEDNLLLQKRYTITNIALFKDAMEADIYASLLMENKQ